MNIPRFTTAKAGDIIRFSNGAKAQINMVGFLMLRSKIYEHEHRTWLEYLESFLGGCFEIIGNCYDGKDYND
jgi:hypothetical protein